MIAALLLALATHAAPNDASGIAWIENDFDGAVAKAALQGKPVFVDVWALWCHSCQSMKRYVFTDAGMRPAAEAAIFVALDQELPKNRAFVAKYPVDGLPTFLLLEPKGGKIISRWLGSGTVADLRSFVVHGREQLEAMKGTKVAPALQAARLGDEAQLKGDKHEAAKAYETALRFTAEGDWVRPQLISKLLTAWRRVGTPEALARCVDLGLAQLDKLGKSAVAADAASYTAACAEGSKENPRSVEAREKALKVLLSVAGDPAAPLSADDRSDALGNATGLLDEAGRHAEAVKASEQRRDLLLAAQKAAPDAEMASTFDPHLAETYLYLKQAALAEAMLTAREKEMPDDYNPPARLARVLLEQKKLAAAEQAIDRALKLSPPGPRKVGFFALKEKIVAALGKPIEPVLREELALLEALPQTQRRPQLEQKIRAQLAKKE